MRAHWSDGHLYSGDKVRKLQAKHYFLIDTGAGEKVFLHLYMSVNGRFNNTDCLPVTGKDGKTQWIFKLEDLREVVPEDVYEAIEGFTEAAKNEAVDEFLKNWEKEAEVAADGYLSLLRTTREDLEDVISKGEAGLGKKEILIKLKRIRQNINNNL